MLIKRRIITGFIICAILFTGCSNGDKNSINGKEFDAEKNDHQNNQTINSSIDEKYRQQLAVLLEKKEQWEIKNNTLNIPDGDSITFNAGYAYAITDLDMDENLEIVLSGTAGTGVYTTNVIFEYKDSDDIVQWDTSGLSNNDSEPDLRNQKNFDEENSESDYITLFINDNEFFYYVGDYISWDPSGGQKKYLKIYINNNSIASELVGYYEFDYKKVFVSAYDADEKEIDEESLYKIIDEVGEGYEEKKMKLSWFSEANMDNLIESYKCFAGVEKE